MDEEKILRKKEEKMDEEKRIRRKENSSKIEGSNVMRNEKE